MRIQKTLRTAIAVGGIATLLIGAKSVCSNTFQANADLNANPDYKVVLMYDAIGESLGEAERSLEYRPHSSVPAVHGNGTVTYMSHPEHYPSPSEAKDSLEEAIERSVDEALNEDIDVIITSLPDGLAVELYNGEPISAENNPFAEQHASIAEIREDAYAKREEHLAEIPTGQLYGGIKAVTQGFLTSIAGLGLVAASKLVKDREE